MCIQSIRFPSLFSSHKEWRKHAKKFQRKRRRRRLAAKREYGKERIKSDKFFLKVHFNIEFISFNNNFDFMV